MCRAGLHPLYVNVEMGTGKTATHWIDSLQAAFPGVQLLAGDVEEAICHHALYYSIWLRYGCLPERYNWQLEAPDVKVTVLTAMAAAMSKTCNNENLLSQTSDEV